jgi:hypothetical protein
MCDCFQIGGPWISEDPNCPVHGIAAQKRKEDALSLRDKIQNATSLEEANALTDKVYEFIKSSYRGALFCTEDQLNTELREFGMFGHRE